MPPAEPWQAAIAKRVDARVVKHVPGVRKAEGYLPVEVPREIAGNGAMRRTAGALPACPCARPFARAGHDPREARSDLTLVHYCEAGNRPRLVARSSADPKTVDFEFADISGSTKPVYLQHLVFTIVSADHHTEDWTFQSPDEKQLRARFDLKRATEGTPTPVGKARARPH